MNTLTMCSRCLAFLVVCFGVVTVCFTEIQTSSAQTLTLHDITRQYQEYLSRISAVSYDYSDVKLGHRGSIKFSDVGQYWFFVKLKPGDSTVEMLVYNDIATNLYKEENLYGVNSSLKPLGKNVAITSHLHSVIFGHFRLSTDSTIQIVELLKSTSFDVKQREEDGRVMHHLSGNRRHEHWELWFESRDRNLFLTRIKYARSETDLKIGECLKCEIWLDDFKNISSIAPFPSRYTEEAAAMNAKIYQSGEKEPFMGSHRNDYSIDNVQIIPSDFASSFSYLTDVPNYTEVTMMDALQIKYIWLDGKIVPYTDELALARLRGHKFVPGVREVQFWLIALGFVLLMLGVGSGVWKYVKSRNNNDTPK
jgi:hypothetical protein